MDAERYRKLVEHTSDWVWEVDPQGVYVYASPRVEALLGYKPEEVLGKTPFELMPAPEASRVRQIFTEFVAARKPFFSLENVNLHKDGYPVVLETSAVPIFDGTGQLTGYRGIDRDISARKNAETQLRHAKNLAEQAARARARVIDVVSHDLRQPLQSLGLYIRSLRQQVQEPAAEQTIENMDCVVRSMGALLDEFLEHSRLQSDSVSSRPQRIALHERLRAVVATAAPLASEKKLSLRLHARPLWVESDAGLLDRILNNLVFNALKYTDRGGVLLGVRRYEGGIRIEVWDTGPGIEEGSIERIFDEFVQLESNGDRPRQGFGLGLAIVKRAADLIGARIECRSRRGRGSVFSVCLDSADADPYLSSRLPGDAGLDGAWRDMPILIVEDDEFVVDSMQLLLRSSGFAVRSASSAEAAYALLDGEGFRPRLIVADLHLPGSHDGVAVLAGVQQRLGVAVPGLIITGEATRSNVDIGGDGKIMVLPKPVEPSQLLEKVRGLLSDAESA